MRIMRANVIDCIRAEYVTAARAKGVREVTVMFVHILRNAINPLITTLGYSFAGLLSGALLVENVMNYPGLGQLIFDALLKEDQYVVMASVLVGVVLLVIGNLLADLLLAWVDPRIRMDSKTQSNLNKKSVFLVYFLIPTFIFLEILMEIYFPAVLSTALFVLKWVGILIISIVLILCLAMTIYLFFVLIKRFLILIFSRLSGAIAFSLLALLYLVAAFSNFLAPYSATEQNLKFPYHPPSQIVWNEGKLFVEETIRIEEGVAEYKSNGKLIPIKFFAKCDSYKLFGFIKLDRKLFQLDTKDKKSKIVFVGL